MRIHEIALLCLLFAATDQADSLKKQPDIAQRLSQGGATERLAAIEEALAVPPGERSGELLRAMATELERVNRLVSEREEPTASDREQLNEATSYYAQLVSAMADSTDPVVLPGLVGALGTGNMAIRGVSRFGNLAVNAVIAVVSNGEEDALKRAMAARALSELLGQPELSRPARAAIGNAIASAFKRPQPFVVMASLLEPAVRTQRVDLIATVERIAANPGDALLSDADAQDRVNIGLRAKHALGR